MPADVPPGLCTRQMLETIEAQTLAPYACHSAASAGRQYDADEDPHRTAFQRDRDRIVHCAAFRRLEYKTQVFINSEGDHYRTRLTHSLEVSQIARSLARMLRLNQDLVEAIALAHDLGHTPFGHAGERALDRLLCDDGGFEHNTQTLRVVEILEHRTSRYPGLNLTEETREGLRKHTTSHDHPPVEPDTHAGALLQPHLCGQVVDIADELAYNNHDIDDGLFAGLLALDDVLEHLPLWREEYERQRKRHPHARRREITRATVSAMINQQITDVACYSAQQIAEAGIGSPDDARCWPKRLIDFSPEMAMHNALARQFLFDALYRHHLVMGEMEKCERMVTDLFSLLVDKPYLLPVHIRKRIGTRDPVQRVVADYIAGMTDRFAIEEYQRLFIPEISLHARR